MAVIRWVSLTMTMATMMIMIIEYSPMIGCLQVGQHVSFGLQLEQTGWPVKHCKEEQSEMIIMTIFVMITNIKVSMMIATIAVTMTSLTKTVLTAFFSEKQTNKHTKQPNQQK